MDETKDVIKELEASLVKLEEDWPKQRSAFATLSEVTKSSGALDAKYKYLIAIGIAVSSHCHWCIAVNVKNALAHGATKEEVMEAGWVAVQMGGGPSLAHLQLVQKALDDLLPQS